MAGACGGLTTIASAVERKKAPPGAPVAATTTRAARSRAPRPATVVLLEETPGPVPAGEPVVKEAGKARGKRAAGPAGRTNRRRALRVRAVAQERVNSKPTVAAADESQAGCLAQKLIVGLAVGAGAAV